MRTRPTITHTSLPPPNSLPLHTSDTQNCANSSVVLVLVVVLQEWLCVCADIVPAAAAASPTNTVHHHPDGGQSTASNGDSTPPLSTTPPATNDQPERLTPAALVAVHRVVLGLHTWALATDGGQPRTTSTTTVARGNDEGGGRGGHINQNTNTKSADEYQHQRQQPSHTHAHNKPQHESVEGPDNYHYSAAQRRPNSLDFAGTNGNGTMRRRTVVDAHQNALNNNNNGADMFGAAAPVIPKSKKRSRSAPPKRTFGPNGQLQLIGIEEEECEYDSDAGKFTCAIVGTSSAESSSVVTTADTIGSDVSSVTDFVADGGRSSLDETGDDEMTEMVEAPQMVMLPVATPEERRRSTLLCVAAFLLTVLWLYWFPVAE